MFKNILTKIVGDPNAKEIERLQPIVEEINALEPEFERLSDEELRDKTAEFKGRYYAGEPLDSLLPEAFAAVREASKRTIGLRHFDVQLVGGIMLHQGKVVEMKTGEGKTLVATLPLYLNALEGKGVHLVTVNDYLAKRDTQWMGPIYHALGLTVGVIQSQTDEGVVQPAFLFDPTYQASDDRYRHLRPIPRQDAYRADITYGTNNEFGFDYLRDNMVLDLSQCVQRELHYAIVDEVDNILIDEARTPLIISGPAEESAEAYHTFARLVPRLRAEEDYVVDEKARIVTLTEEGISKMERWLGLDNLYSPQNYHLTPYLEQALRAHVLYKRDRDYIVKDRQVIIVDEFTGRLMYGRRYSEGLHQAIEAKEGVPIQRESLTLATITFQNYFRMYEKLAGMTGTAATEAEEFHKIYGLDVVVLPTNVEYRATYGDLVTCHRRLDEIAPVTFAGVLDGRDNIEITTYEKPDNPLVRYYKRLDLPDVVYKNEAAKFRAVVREIEELHKQGRPVLVGTVFVERSEMLSELLRRRGIPHQVLNAKHHEKEALIIAQAGRPGAVTIATNMAGRGVDIKLGGDPEGLAREQLRKEGVDLTQIHSAEWDDAVKMLREGQDPTRKYPERWAQVLAEMTALCRRDHDRVLKLGGLHVLGTERHEARRIDNQLRGRSGRLGDPGSSRFYVSLEDDLMRRFGGERVKGFMEWAGVDEDIPIEHDLVTKSIESAQVKVEGYNFDIRKHLLEYDDVINQQRNVIYDQRRKILSQESLKPIIMRMVQDELRELVALYTGGDYRDEWDLAGLYAAARAIMPLPPTLTTTRWEGLRPQEIAEQLLDLAERLYEEKEQRLGAETMRQLERLVMLRVVDTLWIRHLTALDDLREGIGLRAYGQQDPLVTYKREAFDMFQRLTANIEHDIVHTIYHVDVMREPQPRPMREMRTSRGAISTGAEQPRRPVKVGQKIGRNDPCPCGSGKKYKYCHGRRGAAQGAPVQATASAPATASRGEKKSKKKKKRKRGRKRRR
ncbi:MAG: preprotein translocase subunit SecA [Anaerolineae bacterium]